MAEPSRRRFPIGEYESTSLHPFSVLKVASRMNVIDRIVNKKLTKKAPRRRPGMAAFKPIRVEP